MITSQFRYYFMCIADYLYGLKVHFELQKRTIEEDKM